MAATSPRLRSLRGSFAGLLRRAWNNRRLLVNKIIEWPRLRPDFAPSGVASPGCFVGPGITGGYS